MSVQSKTNTNSHNIVSKNGAAAAENADAESRNAQKLETPSLAKPRNQKPEA